MPLPLNSSLSLLDPSKLGDAQPVKTKRAMLVRLSPDTLDALENAAQSQLQFEFGENSGLFIGQSYFPLTHIQESGNHELYLRAPSASKRNAPLKLYANVIGKFTVEKTEIGDDLRNKIRESTQEAVAQKSNRSTTFIPTPPEPTTASKKPTKGPPSMFRKPLRPKDKVEAAAPSSTPPPPNQKIPVMPVPSSSQSTGVPIRRRLVQCLAKGEKSEDEVFKLLAVTDRNPNLRAEILELLDQLADSRVEKSYKFFSLKPTAWKEVRPLEYSGLSEQERRQMALAGKAALKLLRVPEGDSIWGHFEFKSATTSLLAKSQTSALSDPSSLASTEPRIGQEAPKRGISSREVKEKKAKAKLEPFVEIQMKDESQRASSSSRPRPESSTDGRKPIENGRDTSSMRRQPPSSRPRPSERDTIERSVSADQQSSARRGEKDSSVSGRRISDEVHALSTKVRRNLDVRASDSERGTPGPSSERVKTKERPIKREPDDGYLDTKPKSSRGRAAEEISEKVRRRRDELVERDDKSHVRKFKREEEYDDLPSTSKRRDEHRESRVPSKSRAHEDDYPEPRKRKLEGDYPSQKSSSKRRMREEDADYASDRQSRVVTNGRVKEDPGSSSKRKVDHDDDYHKSSRPKKLKIARESVSASHSVAREDRDRRESKNGRIERIEPDVKPKIKSASSHPSSSQNRKASPPSNRSLTSRRDSTEQHSSRHESSLTAKSSKSSSKPRRRSPIYTSSEEDEKDDDVPLSARLAIKNVFPTSPTSGLRISPSTKKLARPLPSDHDSLRALYDTVYVDYIGSFQKLLVQKGKIDALLKNGDLDGGSITDSDVLSSEELVQVKSNHQLLRDELGAIREAYDQTLGMD